MKSAAVAGSVRTEVKGGGEAGVSAQKASVFTRKPRICGPSVSGPFPAQPGAAPLRRWAGKGCNHVIAFAGCANLAEWAAGRLQSAIWPDSSRFNQNEFSGNSLITLAPKSQRW